MIEMKAIIPVKFRGTSLPSICSYWVEGKPRKKPQPGLPRPGIEPGPPGFAARLADRYSTVPDANIQSLRAIVKEDEYEEVRWDGIVSIVSERVFRLWWKKEMDCIEIPNVILVEAEQASQRAIPGKSRDRYYKALSLFNEWRKTKASAVQKSEVRIYKTVILPVLLYGCETWTLTLREEHRLRVFENKVLRKIFGAKRDEATGEWRKLHNTELHALYSSPNIIRNLKSRRLRWAGHVARMGESRNAYRVLVGRPEGKRPLGRLRRRWEDNIKMDLREVGCDDRDWINLAQDGNRWRAYVRAAMNLRVP
ncbi:hypothetical protein ANN_12122 [Periplaneta americana]|uniref:Uncharacterized protein n=1 Tax=Periplaneta americana TaxID=6978 RepID=A0ABQ8T706_PERAM|nr:hypothetical protein ANN_12122 [Periplaneta americana]